MKIGKSELPWASSSLESCLEREKYDFLSPKSPDIDQSAISSLKRNYVRLSEPNPASDMKFLEPTRLSELCSLKRVAVRLSESPLRLSELHSADFG